MKICLNCKKAWNKEDIISPDSHEYWKGMKTAILTFCGLCCRSMNNEFELQFKKRTLRLEAHK